MPTRNKKKRLYWLAGNRNPGQDVFFVEALDPSLWSPGDSKNWDTCWYTGMPDKDVFEQLDAQKSINHIPGNNGVTIKNFLHETLQAARTRMAGQPGEERLNFFPLVYSMPDDFHALQHDAHENPKKKWILKPKNSSRGRGIEVVQDIANIPLENKWMVQEYIDNPHVMNARKYVLRLYVLITSVEPLRVYLHQDGFAKLASEPYSIEDPDNPFSHLTNPDINATNTDTDAPVVFVGLAEYRQWLRDHDHDDVALFEKIKDLVTLTVIAVRERMRKRLAAQHAPSDGCYELLGIDCLVDNDLKPWILECNLSPSLEVCADPEDGGTNEEKIKRGMVADMVSLLGLNIPPAAHNKESKKERFTREAAQELSRAGRFQRLFPHKDTAEDYLSFFPVPRLADMVTVAEVLGRTPQPIHLRPNDTLEIISEDELALYYEKTGTFFTPTPVAGWIWLKAAEGTSPQEIARELVASHEAAHGSIGDDEKWMIEENVWDVLSNWAYLGLLSRTSGSDAPAQKTVRPRLSSWAGRNVIKVGSTIIGIDYTCPALAARMDTLLAPLQSDKKPKINIAVQRAPVGYAIAVGAHLVATGLGLDNAAQVLTRALFEQAPSAPHDIAIAGALVPLNDDDAVFFVAGRDDKWEDSLAVHFATAMQTGYSGDVALDIKKEPSALPLGLPLRLNEDDIAAVEKALGRPLPLHVQNWPAGGRGRMLPTQLSDLDKTWRLRAVIIPERTDTAECLCQKASIHSTLEAMLVSAIGTGARHLDGAQVNALNAWMSEKTCLAVRFSNPVEAAQTLMQTLT